MLFIRKLLLALSLGLASVGIMAAPVDINTADAETLAAAIVGVGSSKAMDIIAYRDKHGPFKSIEDLMNVKGIGERTIEKNQEKITVGADSTE